MCRGRIMYLNPSQAELLSQPNIASPCMGDKCIWVSLFAPLPSRTVNNSPTFSSTRTLHALLNTAIVVRRTKLKLILIIERKVS
jgi:hypothetical protein